MRDWWNLKSSERGVALAQQFAQLKDWEARYGRLIELGRAMVRLSESEKSDDLLVKGCQARVWLKASRLPDGRIEFLADSDALITKGLVALLLQFYSHLMPSEILKAQPEFIEEIGLRGHLSPSRANGLNSMIKQIKYYAMAFELKRPLGTES